MRERRAKEIFDRALDQAPERRDAFLERACGPDTRREVERLLAAFERVGGFLERPAAGCLDEIPLGAGARVGDYTVVRLVGRGGGGTIYEAEQRSPRRRVALKVMGGGLASESAQRRFRDEAEMLARLRHPGIATIYEAGVHEGVPFLALEYVEAARTLTAHVREKRLGRRARLRLFAAVCDAVHHGHQKGVIHRDLKPDNVLVDRAGQPRVIDFGIARLQGERAGEVAGTLPYMSPEQCRAGSDVDVRSDVYSLGVLLFELLNGRLPHDLAGVPITEAARRIREEPPAPPDPSLRGDLEAILGKALAKERDFRYGSAAALADDIRRHLEDYPVEARRGGLVYQAGRFARRHRGAVGAAAAFVVLLAAAAIVAGSLAIEKERQRRRAAFQAYVASVAAATAALRLHDVDEALQHLRRAPEELRNWEWRHLRGRLDTSLRTLVWEGRAVYAGAESPDGALLATAGMPDGLRVWDAASGEVLWDAATAARADAVAFDPSSRLLVVGYGTGEAEIRRARSGEVVRTLGGHEGGINAVAFSPEGDLLATGGRDAEIRLWDPSTGERRGTLRGHRDRLIGLSFDATGSRLASSSRDGAAFLWDVASGEVATEFRGHRGSVEGIAVSPDGTRVATCSRDRSVRLWDAATGAPLETWSGHETNVRAVLFAPDGETVVSASYDSTVRLWRRAVGEVACLRGHTAEVMGLALDGKRIVSFSTDGTCKWWDPGRLDPVSTLRGHRSGIPVLAFDPSGTRLASGSFDGDVRVWDVASLRLLEELDARGRPSDLLFPGQLLALTASEVAYTWDLPGGRLVREKVDQPQLAAGRWGRFPHTAGRWDAASGTYEVLMRSDTILTALAADAPGRHVAVGRRDGSVVLADAETGARLALGVPHRDWVVGLAFHPGGRLLASCSRDGTVAILELPALEVRATLSAHSGPVTGIAFSPDGSRLASAGADRTVRLWDVAEARQVATLHGHENGVLCIAWSGDGRRIATADGSREIPGVIRLWMAPP